MSASPWTSGSPEQAQSTTVAAGGTVSQQRTSACFVVVTPPDDSEQRRLISTAGGFARVPIADQAHLETELRERAGLRHRTRSRPGTVPRPRRESRLPTGQRPRQDGSPVVTPAVGAVGVGAVVEEFVAQVFSEREPPELGDPGTGVAMAVGTAVNACGL